ncbi:MAG: DUF2461 domain-containing protein [Chitinophagaceae bacterium]|nr:DUF2461 domain-containing protein [Chitinophagaceae bacterium]
MQKVLEFLKDLAENNNKPWFDENRDKYLIAKKEIETFTTKLIQEFGEIEPSIANLEAKECLFRINRDVRFSKDKSPYKTNFGISINPGGKKSDLAGYYIHIEPGKSFVGGGMWMPMPEQLGKIRQEIDYNLEQFEELIKAPAFKKQYGTLNSGKEISLVRVPKGYEADSPAAEYLKLKSFTATKQLTDNTIASKEFIEHCTTAFKALKPLIGFLNQGLL